METPGFEGNNIQIDLQEVGEGTHWLDVSEQEHVADSCECGNEPWGSIKCGEYLDWLRTC